MGARILTLTLNPTVDVTDDADQVRAIRKTRTRNERFDPGGGGVNVSRVVHALGGETLAVLLAGGIAGALLCELLGQDGVPYRALPISGRTRMAHTVHDLSARTEFRFVPEGPVVSAHELELAVAALEHEPGDWVVLSGSLPRGVPDDIYAELAGRLAAQGRHCVLDTSGPPLKAALGRGLALIKPSRGEFEALVGRPLNTPKALGDAALALVREGQAGLVAVSMGHQGAMLAEPGGVLRLPALEVEALGAVGAGDSFLAGMVLSLARGEPPREAFAWGMATGAAAVTQPGTARVRAADVEALRRRIGPV